MEAEERGGRSRGCGWPSGIESRHVGWGGREQEQEEEDEEEEEEEEEEE